MAAEQFHRARRQAAVESLLARLSGHSTDLLSYEEVADKLRVSGQSPGGLRQIPVSAIVGSVGRDQDFTRTVLPRNQSDEDRWVSVGAAAPVIGDLPPIECYKIGDNYFVLDGNHRVSIAKQQGVDYIDAYITEVRTRVPLPPDARPDDLIVAAEYAAFLEATRLDLTRQNVDMRVSVPGQYRHLENHIEAFRYRLESENGDVPFDEAAARWYDEAYLPLVGAIREQGILRYFPGRTETDFFVWLARHRAELEEELGWQISPEMAVARLLPKAQASERASTRRPSRLRRLTQLVVPERPAVPPVSWAGERLVARYSDRLFANILLPLALDRMDAATVGPALERAVGLSVSEGAQLYALVVGGVPAEPAALDELRARLERERQARGLAAQVDVERGELTQRTIERAYLNDLIVLDRTYNRTPADKPGPTAAAQRILKQAHRPILFVAEKDGPAALPQRALLVHDTRRHLDEAVFLAAYLAERWRVALVALLISNGRNTAAETARIGDYLALHEVNATFLEPARATSQLPEAIVAAAGAAGADLIILPGPGAGQGQHRHPRLDETIVAVLRRWPGAALVAS